MAVPCLLLAGCGGSLSALDPAGPAAHASARLFWAMLAGSLVIFALVCAMFLRAMRRGRVGTAVDARRWIIGGGIVLPTVVLALLLGATLAVGEGQFVREPDLPVVRATASRWQWRFNTVDADGRLGPVRDRLLLRAGQPTIVELVSEDVIHGFWVPRLGGKMDAIPGITNRHLVQADAPGVYAGTCAEYCGIGHDRMRFVVEVLPPQPAGGARAEASTGGRQ